MRKRKKQKRISGAPTNLLVGVMQGDDGMYHWGPFGDIDEMIAWCERHGVQLSVIPLNDPSEDPWEVVRNAVL